MGEGNIFTLCVSPHTGGRGYPHPPAPFPAQNGGYPLPRSGWGVTPSRFRMGILPSQVRTGVPPSQIRMGGTLFPFQDEGYPLPRSGGDNTPPPPHSDLKRGYPPFGRMGVPLPSQPGKGVPPPPILTWNLEGGTPQPEHHTVYLLRGRRYASCVHAGGLSCYKYILINVYDTHVTLLSSHGSCHRPR